MVLQVKGCLLSLQLSQRHDVAVGVDGPDVMFSIILFMFPIAKRYSTANK
jgi:hypothetical protein